MADSSNNSIADTYRLDSPAGTYDPPVDYEKTDKFSMEDLMKR